MSTGFVGILSFRLHFPSHSLKEKRMHLRSVRSSSSRTAPGARSPGRPPRRVAADRTDAGLRHARGGGGRAAARRGGAVALGSGVRAGIGAAGNRAPRGRTGRIGRPERMRRVDEAMKQVLSSDPDAQDPRIRFVTVTAVETSRDLDHAKVWLSVLRRRRASARWPLSRAAGSLQAGVNRELKLRRDRSWSSSTIARSSTACG